MGIEGLEPPSGVPDLQSGAVAAVPYTQFSNSTIYLNQPNFYELVTVYLISAPRESRTPTSSFSDLHAHHIYITSAIAFQEGLEPPTHVLTAHCSTN